MKHPRQNLSPLLAGLVFLPCHCLAGDLVSSSFGSITFDGYQADTYLRGDEYLSFGIESISAVPEGEYCNDATVTILGRGRYRAPFSMLSTAKPNEATSCNGVPVRIDFSTEVSGVEIVFFGAIKPYKLAAFADDGSLVNEVTKMGYPYRYEFRFKIDISGPEKSIKYVTFGYTAALTQILEIHFR